MPQQQMAYSRRMRLRLLLRCAVVRRISKDDLAGVG